MSTHAAELALRNARRLLGAAKRDAEAKDAERLYKRAKVRLERLQAKARLAVVLSSGGAR